MEGAPRLCDLVLVVRKHEIDTATMDVECFAEVLPTHRGAFDMPAGAPGRGDTGRRRPTWLALFRGLPQHEVHRVALVGRNIDTRARHHLVERAPRELPVVRH